MGHPMARLFCNPMKTLLRTKIFILTALALCCSGKVTHDLSEPGIIAQSGAFRVPTKVFQGFFDAMKRSGLPERKDPRAALFLMIADNYLGAEYKSNKGEKIDPAIAAEI